jgi:hypothetical protein
MREESNNFIKSLSTKWTNKIEKSLRDREILDVSFEYIRLLFNSDDFLDITSVKTFKTNELASFITLKYERGNVYDSIEENLLYQDIQFFKNSIDKSGTLYLINLKNKFSFDRLQEGYIFMEVYQRNKIFFDVKITLKTKRFMWMVCNKNYYNAKIWIADGLSLFNYNIQLIDMDRDKINKVDIDGKYTGIFTFNESGEIDNINITKYKTIQIN